MKKVALIPNVITALGLSCGLFVIFRMNMAETGASNYSLIQMSVILILIAAFVDVLDGAVARLIHAESEFGIHFDSLSDSITFGVAPCVVVLKTLSIIPGSELSFFAMCAALIYSVCGVLRLVRFNVKAFQPKGNSYQEISGNKNFTGLPIPASAIALVSLNLFLASDSFDKWFDFKEESKAICMLIGMVILGYFMISRWKFPSVKSLNFKVPTYRLVLITVLLSVLVLYSVFNHLALLSVILSWGYLISAWVLSIVRLIAGKKSKTLEDFEPEPEDVDD
jgi:CDP-diacylglycerol--serine O-phosphatidyltransferase